MECSFFSQFAQLHRSFAWDMTTPMKLRGILVTENLWMNTAKRTSNHSCCNTEQFLKLGAWQVANELILCLIGPRHLIMWNHQKMNGLMVYICLSIPDEPLPFCDVNVFRVPFWERHHLSVPATKSCIIPDSKRKHIKNTKQKL